MVARAALAGASFLIALFSFAAAADAHESPPGCTTGSLNARITGDASIIHRNGDVIQLIPGYWNGAAGSCDVTGVTVTITLPNPDGSPGGGQSSVVATGLDIAGATGNTALAPVSYTVNLNDGVFKSPVTVKLSGGTFHGPGGDSANGDSSISTNVVISRPHVTLTVTPSVTTGPSPLGVTYTYHATNDSPFDSTPLQVQPEVVDSVVTDDRCSPVTYVSGDTTISDPMILNYLEDWTFTCTATIGGGGPKANHASFNGNSIRDGRPWPTATAESNVTPTGADPAVAISHQGPLVRGSPTNGTVTVTNAGNADTSGTLTAALTMPAGLTATSLEGPGWTCVLAALSCSRSDALAADAGYPPIAVSSDVGSGAPASVTTKVDITGGGDTEASNNSASDVADVTDPADPGPGPGPGPGPDDKTAPVISGLRVTPKKFRVPSKKAKVTFSLTEKASVVLKTERKVKKKGARTKWKPVAGSVKATGKSGANRLKFTGRVGGKRLKPGSYRLKAVAADASGNTGRASSKKFTISR